MLGEEKLEQVSPVSISKPCSYSFRFKWGWAIFTINEATGEFSIQSDWGNYNYRWNIRHTGYKTMTEFVAHAGAHYIVDKFSYGRHPDLVDVVDEEKTKQALYERIIEKRKEKEIDRYEARHYYDYVGSWVSEDCNALLCGDDEFDKFFKYSLWEYIRYRPSGRREFLTNHLLPWFQNWLKYNETKGDSPLPEGAMQMEFSE